MHHKENEIKKNLNLNSENNQKLFLHCNVFILKIFYALSPSSYEIR